MDELKFVVGKLSGVQVSVYITVLFRMCSIKPKLYILNKCNKIIRMKSRGDLQWLKKKVQLKLLAKKKQMKK